MVANNTDTATIETSPVTGVRFEKEYSVGAPSSRKASNHPFIISRTVLKKEQISRTETILRVQVQIKTESTQIQKS